MPPARGPRRRGRTWDEDRSHAKFPIAYVKYHDHCWLESKELEDIEAATPFVVEEAGFLLHETPTYVTIAKERSTDGEKDKVQYDSVTIIMRSDILSLEVFHLGRGRRNGSRAPKAHPVPAGGRRPGNGNGNGRRKKSRKRHKKKGPKRDPDTN